MGPKTAPTVAVIGLGAHGLVAVKNLLEEGFDVTGFDRNDYIGGLWHYSPEDTVSCLPTTIVNVSRERACFTDFAFREGTGSYPTSREVDQYLHDYCDHFKLREHLRLGVTFIGLERDEQRRQWSVKVKLSDGRTESLIFDKLVGATGPQNVPIIPALTGRELFAGDVIHSVAFKNPQKFKGQKVVVLGFGNTAVDTATQLAGVADKVYLSHRNGAILLPRILIDGTSLDHGATYRTFGIRDVLQTMFPGLAVRFIDNWVANVQKKNFKLRPEWRIDTPTPSLSKQNPTVSDNLVPALESGGLKSVHGIKQFVGDRSIELEDGTLLEDMDTVILCTGYRVDLSWLGQHDPTAVGAEDDVKPKHDYGAPRLYQNILSHQHPDSLAFIGLSLALLPAFVVADLSSMALAQMWSKPELLPSAAEIEKQFQEHLAWRSYINALPNEPGKGPMRLQIETGQFLSWAQGVAGIRLDEHLSYASPAAWKFWWQEPKLCRMLMDGIYSPHAYRLFDSEGRRKTWDGAREAIEKVNKDVKTRLKGGGLKIPTSMLPGDVVAQS